MKRFRFALAKVLDVREIARKESERLLARALEEEEVLAARLRELEGLEQSSAAALAAALAESALHPLKLMTLHHELAGRSRQCAEGRVRCLEGERKTRAAREALLKRRAEVESLEILRRKAEETWSETVRRQEMDAMDELASQRHQRRKATRSAT